MWDANDEWRLRIASTDKRFSVSLPVVERVRAARRNDDVRHEGVRSVLHDHGRTAMGACHKEKERQKRIEHLAESRSRRCEPAVRIRRAVRLERTMCRSLAGALKAQVLIIGWRRYFLPLVALTPVQPRGSALAVVTSAPVFEMYVHMVRIALPGSGEIHLTAGVRLLKFVLNLCVVGLGASRDDDNDRDRKKVTKRTPMDAPEEMPRQSFEDRNHGGSAGRPESGKADHSR